MEKKPPQINVNSLLVTLLIGLTGWGGNKVIDRIDQNNTKLIELMTNQAHLMDELHKLQTSFSDLVKRDEFETAIEALQNEVDRLRAKGP